MVKKGNHVPQRFKLRKQRSVTPHLLVSNNMTRSVTGTCSELHAKESRQECCPKAAIITHKTGT